MDRRTLIAITLSVAIYVAWFAMFPPPVPPPEVPEGAPVAEASGPPATAPADAPLVPAEAGAPGLPAVVPVALCGFEAEVHTVDGSLRNLVLPHHAGRYQVQPLWSWLLDGAPGTWKPYGDAPGPARLLGVQAAGLVAGAGPIDQPGPRLVAVEATDDRVVTAAEGPGGLRIERTLQARGEGEACRVEVTYRWTNQGSAPWSLPTWVGVHDVLAEASGQYDVPLRPRALADGSVEGIEEGDELDGPWRLDGAPGWIGLADTYFLVALAPAEGTAPDAAVIDGVVRAQATPAALYGAHHVWDAPLAPGATREARYQLYAGLKVHDTLAAVDPSLSEAVELGFFSAFGWPLLWLLERLHGFTQDWGLAIIALTFLVKAVFFPLTQAGFKSGQAMSALQPQMQEIRATYKDNPEELNRRTMQLFQENKVNPLGGCLPMLLQMPVWFALFTVLQNTADLYHTEFLYLRDLSQPDPYLASPALVAVMMIVQQRLTPMANLDPAQQQMMRIMPVVFSVFFFMLPAGLVVYTFVNMSLSILQQAYIKRTFRSASDKAALTPA